MDTRENYRAKLKNNTCIFITFYPKEHSLQKPPIVYKEGMMASLLCHYCHSRITENGMSNGVQHYMFPFSTWELYSKTDKPIVLYLTEGPENFFTIWKCHECGCFHLMPGYKALVLRSYFPTEPPVHPIVTDEPQYLIFDDYRGPLKTPLAREEKKVIMTS